MLKNTLRGLSVILGLIFIIGCASSKNVEVRRYVDIKDRVDQDMDKGNAGFLGGEPQPEDRSAFRPTRKIYVVEVSQGDLIEGKETIVEESGNNMIGDGSLLQEPAYDESDNYIEVSRDADVSSYIGDETEVEAYESASSFTGYTVKKDDTLQKISKKFYDSFAKWPRIYEANKDVIDNPDRIKPGIVIQIPME